jgi:hypothetical protein
MAKNNWRQKTALDYFLYDRSVRSQRSPVQTRNMDTCAMAAQIVRQPVEMGRLMPQSMDEYDFGRLIHSASLRSPTQLATSISTHGRVTVVPWERTFRSRRFGFFVSHGSRGQQKTSSALSVAWPSRLIA